MSQGRLISNKKKLVIGVTIELISQAVITVKGYLSRCCMAGLDRGLYALVALSEAPEPRSYNPQLSVTPRIGCPLKASVSNCLNACIYSSYPCAYTRTVKMILKRSLSSLIFALSCYILSHLAIS